MPHCVRSLPVQLLRAATRYPFVALCAQKHYEDAADESIYMGVNRGTGAPQRWFYQQFSMSSESKTSSILSPFQNKKKKQQQQQLESPLVAPVGLSDPQYANRKRAMFDFINSMRALGVDVNVDIPTIVAIGWQSAGKSSLIEAISGITLPRANGTCTRCPTECQLKYSDTPWTCSVWLQLNTAADGSVLTNSQKIPFGEPITEKSEVTERVRRAQRAILSPSTRPDVFLSGADTATERSFSENRIVLHIAGPDVDDLNFIDLPGLFVGGDEEHDMQLVKELATSYIDKPSCIILLTVACETDFVNQGAHRLAREYDPRGDRTVGVLTKPDRIPATEEESWLPYIRGEREDTTWFCIKCPNSEAIKSGITWEDARQQESTWFSSKSPWSTLEEPFRQRLGTTHLTRCLSDKLYDLIAERLPLIEQQLKELLEKINRDLGDLPPPPSSAPLKEVLRLITDFSGEVKRQGEGIPGRDGLLHQIKLPQDKFRIAIRRTVPCFVPQYRNKSSDPAGPVGSDVDTGSLSLAEEYAESEPEGFPSEPSEVDDTVKVAPHTYPSFLMGEERSKEIGLNNGKEVFMDDVLETAECAITRELPNNYPFIVQKEYILAFVGQWERPAQTLFTTFVEKVKGASLRVVDIHFGNYTHTRFKQRVSNIVTAHLDQCSKEASQRIKSLLKVEKEPSTRNTDYFKDYRRKFLSFYTGLFRQDLNSYFFEYAQGHRYQSPEFTTALNTIMANLPKIGLHNVKPLELAVLQISEDSADALKIMANVRAYFQVSFKRFVDNAIKAIDEELILGLSNGLQEALISGLKLDSSDAHDTCAKLIAEQPQIAEKRKNLVASQKKLLLAQEEIYDLYNVLA